MLNFSKLSFRTILEFLEFVEKNEGETTIGLPFQLKAIAFVNSMDLENENAVRINV